ncbi:MAG: hypothetical protein CO108_23800 [Deltaproteobacteria bacterium CG_4_9_14_3_um_filter_63_12]|nr:MAG: hypothetical protein CO108_23800 [Deltaproteobacteria bacterium CG_4_9_14_3_um_filter_63_12]
MRVCPECFSQESDEARFCGLCGTQLFEVDSAAGSLIGLVLADKYVIQELIARGGMGEVYLAKHKAIGQKVAVKILNRRFKGDETVVKRFFNEAKTYCRVTHPNAVTLHDFGQLPDTTGYIVMEYVDGKTLTEFMRERAPLPQTMTLKLCVKLAEVLLAAHNQGVVHRDLKPDNIMLTESSKGRFQLKVLDFGIAKLLGDTTDQLTETGMVFGTPEFMSPEQAQGFDIDHRADIYAFGTLLFYMLTNKLPFEGINKLAILNKQVHEAPRTPSQAAPDLHIDADLEVLIMKCLEKERAKRFDSFDVVLEELERILSRPIDESVYSAETRAVASPHTAETVLIVKEVPGADPLQAMFDSAPHSGEVPTVRPDLASFELVTSDEGFPVDDDVEVITIDPMDDVEIDDEDDQAATVIGDDNEEEATHVAGPPAPGEEGVEEVTQERRNKRRPDSMAFGAAVLPSREEAFHIDSDEDNDEFSLGGDLLVGDLDDESPTRRRSGGGHLGVFLVLLFLLAGGGAAWFFLTHPSNGAQPKSPAVAESGADVSDGGAEQADAVASEVAVAQTTDVVGDQVVSSEPATEPPKAIDAALRGRVLAKVLVDLIDARIRTAEFTEAKKFIKFAKKAEAWPAEVGVRFDHLEDTLTAVQDTLKAAQKSAKRLKCAEVKAKADELLSLSPAAAQQATELVSKCERELAAPPSRID